MGFRGYGVQGFWGGAGCLGYGVPGLRGQRLCGQGSRLGFRFRMDLYRATVCSSETRGGDSAGIGVESMIKIPVSEWGSS